MANIHVLNAPLVANFVAAMGATPGFFRDTQADAYYALYAPVVNAYKHLPPSERAQGFNNLSFQMRRLGYAQECYRFATASLEADDSDIVRNFKNMSFAAYATGMMAGNYKDGIALYDGLEQVMRDAGKFDDTALIKAWQNRGQIYHRMGRLDPVFYGHAETAFRHALGVLSASSGIPAPGKMQFRGQVAYAFAKTLVQKAGVIPTRAAGILDDAHTEIDYALEINKTTPNFEFERACFKAVMGEVLAAMGRQDEALPYLQDALEGQQKYGPTLAPRIASTMIKIDRLARREPSGAMRMLEAFYGKKGHPDLAHYYRVNQGRLTTGIDKRTRFLPL